MEAEKVLTLIDCTSFGGSSQASSSQSLAPHDQISDDFKATTRTKVNDATKKSRELFGACLVLTNKSVFILRLEQDPCSLFLELAMRGGDNRKTEGIAASFDLAKKDLLELAADMRLAEKDITNAISLYRSAGCRHLKVVLKFAASGAIQELLSYLTVLFKTPNLEVTPSDRIHLSNLALMSYFQQAVTKITPTSRCSFQEQIKEFVAENRWFDECLSVRLASETREWDLLHHIARTRGLQYEMVESIVGLLRGKGNERKSDNEVLLTLKEMTSSERNGLLKCLLNTSNLEAVAFDKEMCLDLVAIMAAVLTLLEETGLESLLQQCSPSNAGLWHLYYPGLGDPGASTDAVLCALLSLTITCALQLIKKQAGRRQSDCDMMLYSPTLVFPENRSAAKEKNQSIPVERRDLSAGASHVLLVKRNNSLMSWGSTSNAVLGHGPLSSRFSIPKRVDFFRHSRLTLLSVASGKAHSMALTEFGLYVWGSSKHGQLGLGRERLFEQRPVLVPFSATRMITSIASGQYHSVALDRSGRVWTWGWGVHGQLGQDDIEDQFHPTQVRGKLAKQSIVQIAAGYAHTLALSKSGQVWAFGCALFGQLGNADTKKSTVPICVDTLVEKIRLIACGYFHNVALSAESDTMFMWGCNPQVLRLEAQQKKRQRLNMALSKELESQKIGNSDDEVTTKTSVATANVTNESNEDEEVTHMTPLAVDTSNVGGSRIVDVRCGNQHSLLLDEKGAVFAFGRNVDGQLGNNSRSEERIPVRLQTFSSDDVLCQIDCGGDYSLAINEAGSVFAWGSNASGQLGRVPVMEGDNDDNSATKVIVMKTTRRIIRLQNNLHNVCDVPRPVIGINEHIYSAETDDVPRGAEDGVGDIMQRYAIFRDVADPEKLLHLVLETFHNCLDTSTTIKKCLMANNLLAAAKLSFLSGNGVQAFEFSLQLGLRQASVSKADNPMQHLSRIFDAFLHYLNSVKAKNEREDDEELVMEQRKQLLERLIACWLDQKMSFLQLESLCLSNVNPLLLQTIVLTLFCPDEDRQTEDKPVVDGESGPKLVDLFTPEFCLKVGDIFVKDIASTDGMGKRLMTRKLSKDWLLSKEVKEF